MEIKQKTSDRQLKYRKVLLTGGSGFIGSPFMSSIKNWGWSVHNLTRVPHQKQDIVWDPGNGIFPEHALDGVDIIVHLAGENISSGRWTKARKQLIRESRIEGTRILAEGISKMERKPELFICASGANCYMSDGQAHDEASPMGSGFLAELVQEWEAACAPAIACGVRTIHLRLGMVLDPGGGALAKMLPVFKRSLGGTFGSGQQHVNWITLVDLIRVLQFCIENNNLEGPVNAVSPKPVPQEKFAELLAEALGAKAIMPVPQYVVKLLYGQMGEELLLDDMNVLPKKLKEAGFGWIHSDLKTALHSLLA
jgi:hypothetical protein